MGLMWRTSSYCSMDSCVRVNITETYVEIEDQAGNVTTFDHNEWAAFIAGVKAGEFETR